MGSLEQTVDKNDLLDVAYYLRRDKDLSDKIKDYALNNPLLGSIATKGKKLPKKFYDILKRNSKELAESNTLKRLLSQYNAAGILGKLKGGVTNGRNFLYDNTIGRFYPYVNSIGGYMGKIWKYINPINGLYNAGKYLLGQAVKAGGKAIWGVVGLPLLGLAGGYAIYKTVRYFLNRKKKKVKEKEFASREQLEDLAYKLKLQQAGLENIIAKEAQ